MHYYNSWETSIIATGSKAKEDFWKEIAKKLNAVNTTPKDKACEGIQKKWFDLRSRTKAKVATNNKERSKKRGGASAVELNAVNQVLGSFVEEELHGIEGFESGDNMGQIEMNK